MIPDAPDAPKAATALVRRLVGWSTALVHGSGQLAFGGLSEDTDGEGKRHRVSSIEDVDSVLVRARHVDGRALVALWIRRPGASWKFDFAWRARHVGESAPSPINSRQLTAYATALDAHQALRALDQPLCGRPQSTKEAA
jgi:hypothetical protein